MFSFDEDMVSDIYSKQKKLIERDKWLDKEYSKRYNYLNDCIEELRCSLSPKQNMSLEKLIGAMQLFNSYNECKKFGNGMKYMNDLNVCLKNKY